MPWSSALFTAGRIASESWARMISASAPCEIRFSTSVSCCSADDPASAEMYLAPRRVEGCLDGGLVPLRPALLVVVVPGDTDGDAPCLRWCRWSPVVRRHRRCRCYYRRRRPARTARSSRTTDVSSCPLLPDGGAPTTHHPLPLYYGSACLRGFDTAVRNAPSPTDASWSLGPPPRAPKSRRRHTMAQFPGPRNKRERCGPRHRGRRAGTVGSDLLHHFDVLGYPAFRAAGSPGERGSSHQPE